MKNKYFYLFFFVIILAISRLIPHPPNFTPILASAIIGPLMIKDRLYGVAIPIIAMFISDIILGFHSYQFIIYSTILVISLISPMKKNYIKFAFLVFTASLWFFICTNFAVWLILDYYPKNIEGLISCYILALPFFKNTLISTMCFTGLFLITMKNIEKIQIKIHYMIINFLGKIRYNNR